MKLLFVAVLRDDQFRNRVIKALNEVNQNGAVIPSTSIRHALIDSNIEPLPEFGALRHIVESGSYMKSTLLIVIEEEQLPEITKTIKNACEGFSENAGMMYALPITYFEEPIN